MLKDRLRELRKSKGLTKKAVSDVLNMSPEGYGYYESGLRTPSPETISTLADFYQVSTDYIHSITNDPRRIDSVRIPVYGTIPAGIPMEAIEDILDYEEIPAEMTAGSKEYFALKISGDSMEPDYIEGDVVIFLKAQTCDSGDECAVIVNGDHATFKKVIRKENGVYLQPLNITKHDPVFYTNDEIIEKPVDVIGIAKELRRKK